MVGPVSLLQHSLPQKSRALYKNTRELFLGLCREQRNLTEMLIMPMEILEYKRESGAIFLKIPLHFTQILIFCPENLFLLNHYSRSTASALIMGMFKLCCDFILFSEVRENISQQVKHGMRKDNGV